MKAIPLALMAFVLSLSAMCGCGAKPPDTGPVGTVSGFVVMGGQPVTGGRVQFNLKSTPGVGGGADLDAEGKFKIPIPIPVGEYVIIVTPPTPQATPDSNPEAAKLKESAIPTKYRELTTTDLAAEVMVGANTRNFELKP